MYGKRRTPSSGVWESDSLRSDHIKSLEVLMEQQSVFNDLTQGEASNLIAILLAKHLSFTVTVYKDSKAWRYKIAWEVSK